MPVPQNAQAMYSFLTAHGLSANAAAGIIGNIAQESGGNPESVGSGGGGLIGWTPLRAGLISGNSMKDLAVQLNAVMAYIAQNGSVADINAHSPDPTSAATWFMNKYERPKAGPSANVSNRTGSAVATAQAAKSGNWPASSNITLTASTSSSSASTASVGGIGFPGLDQIIPFFSDASSFINKVLWLTKPSNWIRVGAFLAGVALLLFAIHAFIAVGNGEPIIKSPNIVPVPV